MMRDYDNLQAQYKLAQSKTSVAETGEQMEEDRQAERFEVLEQASVPDEPISPNKPRILLVGAARKYRGRSRLGHFVGAPRQEYPQHELTSSAYYRSDR